VSLQACSEPDLRVQLKTAPPDDPFAAATALEVVVQKGAEEIARTSGAATRNLELPSIAWEDGLTIYVAGLSSTDALVAHGAVSPELPESPEECCVVLCFCSEDLHRNGACGCGTNACRPSCE
jgi:hypothetical protein